MIFTKACTKCGEEKPATNEYFSKSKLGKYGLKSQCKKCLSYKKLTEEERKRKTEQAKRYRDNNKERFKELYKERYYKDVEASRAKSRRYVERNKEKIKERRKECPRKRKYTYSKDSYLRYKEANREKILQRGSGALQKQQGKNPAKRE